MIAIAVKHLHGVSFVSKLFLSVVSYIIVLFVYLSSPIWNHLLLIFHTSLVDIWRSERDCQLKICSGGWTHYSVHSTHYSVGCGHYSIGCILYSVGCTPYSVAWAQCITDRSVANIYSVGCAECSVSCKHILYRLYTLLGSLTFSGKVLKNKLNKKLYSHKSYGASTGCVGCPRLQLPWRGSPWWCPRKIIFCVIKYCLEKSGDVGRAAKNSTVQTTFDFRLPPSESFRCLNPSK